MKITTKDVIYPTQFMKEKLFYLTFVPLVGKLFIGENKF